ncbi:MAG: J domain-containing protein, partial [Xenococcaceae cyanobacterium MO_167.B52]|nr:J domain-containing protein [Xenococcaceae cyanobacterium MO_167.B52]
ESEALQIAQEQIQILESQLKEKEEQLQQQEEQLKQSENFSFLLLTHRLLAPGLPLNGTENTPAMRVLGSPKTLTELDCNYRELIKKEHPDVSLFPQDVAIERFGYLRSLYRITRENWEVLKPTAVISKEQLEVRMNATMPFEVDSFWIG